MSRSRKPDPSKGNGVRAVWSYQEVPNGSSTVGYIAGSPYGVYTHYRGATRPCRREFTDSLLQCPLCESGEEPVWKGYVPYYDRDFIKRFVLISREIEESVSAIPLHAQIRISRAKSSKAAVIVREEKWTVKNLPYSAYRAAGVDLEGPLLLIWKDPELHAFVRRVSPVDLIRKQLVPTVKKDEPEPSIVEGFHNLKARMTQPTPEPSLIGDVLENRLPPDATPHKNGKAKSRK